MKSFFFTQYTVYLPKWWFVTLLLVLSMIGTVTFIRNIAYYLAVTRPIYGDYLVVEGWQDESSLKQALDVFETKQYERLITTGGPDKSQLQPLYKTYAEQSAAFFLSQGLSADKLIVIAAPASAQDRTFLSAVMVRTWFENQQILHPDIDIFTQAVHARRTQTLYKKAFQFNTHIGIYASNPENYHLSTWWKTSDGAKSVITEVVGMLWVTCCFDAGKYGSHQEKWGIYGKDN